MKVIRAEVLGFCMGVRRAVDAAEKALSESDGSPCFTLGPLIHNPSVMASFAERGMGILDSSPESDFPDGARVVIRAHGTTPDVLRNLQEKNASVIDATCPKVHLSQRRVREWSEKGYSVIIAGDRNHGEVTSISSYCAPGTNVTVVQNSDEASGLELDGKSVLIAQTTFSPTEYERIIDIVAEKCPEAEVFHSICSATMKRQEALLALEGKVDGILVIGGKNSANTRRLYESAVKISGKAALIEDESEIPDEFYGVSCVGLSAGASTPDSVIDAVESRLMKGRN
jgi:4-hydroxy-3-methylbut-2-enyl diphosphate reductase